jgi:RecB family endonuclease NucS
MPIEMALWRLEGDKGTPVSTSSMETEKRLENILENDVGILGLGQLLLIGRQVPTRFGKVIDLLALAPDGDVYIIELKRDRTSREVVAQALDYGSWARGLGYEDIAELFLNYTHGADFDEAQQDAFC